MSAPSGRGRLRRTWPQRLLITFNVCCIVAALGGAAMIAYAKQTVGQISRVTIGRDTITPADELASGEPQNFLIVGVDSADGLDPDSREVQGRGSLGGVRPDVIMVVRVDPSAGQARILSLPRDLWVDVPGQGRDQINHTMAYGENASPGLLIETIGANFGIDVNHYVQVDFAAFKGVVDHIGGVELYLSHPVRDGAAGLDQPEAGCVLLDADQALAYARSRTLQYQDANGRWIGDPTADLGRNSRQQELIRQMLSRAIDRGARNPATLARMVETGVQTIQLDPFTSPQHLITLGRAFRDYDPNELQTDSLPVVDVFRNGSQTLDLIEARAEPILERYRGGGSDDEGIDPSTITVRVLNGTGQRGQGADVSAQLRDAGFKVSEPGNETARPLRTEVRFPAGEEERAATAARYLLADPVLVPSTAVTEITVVTGPDLLGVLDTPRPAEDVAPPTATTSTTTTTTTEATDGDGWPDTTTGTTAVTIADDDEDEDDDRPPGYLPGAPPPGESCG